MRRLVIVLGLTNCCGLDSGLLAKDNDDWKHRTVTEVSPGFGSSGSLGFGGRGPTKTLVIEAGDLEATAGAWVKRFPVKGGRFYQFLALRKTKGVKSPRRSTPAKITWQDDNGRIVKGYSDDLAQPEYPRDGSVTATGWTSLTDVYRLPRDATFALVELHLRWTKNSEVRWRTITLVETAEPKSRKVRLAVQTHHSTHRFLGRGTFLARKTTAAIHGGGTIPQFNVAWKRMTCLYEVSTYHLSAA